MKKTRLIALFLLPIVTNGFEQEKPDSVSVNFFVDNEIQNIDSSLFFEFSLTVDSIFAVYPQNEKIKAPDFGDRDFAQISFVYNDSTIVIPKVSIKDYLVYSEEALWIIGIDSIPFDKEYLKDFPVWKTTTKVFYWNIVSDNIEDLLVIPLNGSPEINFPTFEEYFDCSGIKK